MFLLLYQTLQKVDSLHFCWHSSALETKKESSTINLLAMQDATGTRINKNGMLFCIEMMTVAMLSSVTSVILFGIALTTWLDSARSHRRRHIGMT